MVQSNAVITNLRVPSESVRTLKIIVVTWNFKPKIGYYLSLQTLIHYNRNCYNLVWNLCTTATLETQKLLLLLTGGHCSEVPLCYEQGKRGNKIVVAVDKWSLFGGGRLHRFDCTFKLFRCSLKNLNKTILIARFLHL